MKITQKMINDKKEFEKIVNEIDFNRTSHDETYCDDIIIKFKGCDLLDCDQCFYCKKKNSRGEKYCHFLNENGDNFPLFSHLVYEHALSKKFKKIKEILS